MTTTDTHRPRHTHPATAIIHRLVGDLPSRSAAELAAHLTAQAPTLPITTAQAEHALADLEATGHVVSWPHPCRPFLELWELSR